VVPLCVLCREVWKDGGAIVEIILIAVFCLDILISFFVGYYDEAGLLVMFNKAVAWYYFRCVVQCRGLYIVYVRCVI
jgi:hypothetical protein